MRANPLLLCPLLLASTAPAVAQAEEDLANLFTQGKPILDLRYRYEHVDQDNALDHANAQTLRTRAGFQTGSWYGFSGLLEADNVSRIGDERFNDTRNGRGNYSVVGDPDGTEINQALLRYDHARGSAVAGRQRIELDNQRFVGGVAWRQNEQTYDGFLGQLKPLDKLTLTYAYLDNINTPFGPDGQHGYPTNPANIEGHSHLFNVAYAWRPELKVTAYSYLLGLDNLAVAPTAAPGSQSSCTSGMRLAGAREGFSYALEYARQRDYGNNPLDLNGHYFLGELGYQQGGYPATRCSAGRRGPATAPSRRRWRPSTCSRAGPTCSSSPRRMASATAMSAAACPCWAAACRPGTTTSRPTRVATATARSWTWPTADRSPM